MRRSLHIESRKDALERTSRRQIEKQALKFKSNQPILSEVAEDLGHISMQDPKQFNDFYRKRTVEYMYSNPSKTKTSGNITWKSINCLPKSKLNNLIRNKTLQRDQEACEHVAKRIEEDDVAEKIHQAMRVKSRLDTRARFLRQKEKNIEAERKGGVIKDY